MSASKLLDLTNPGFGTNEYVYFLIQKSYLPYLSPSTEDSQDCWSNFSFQTFFSFFRKTPFSSNDLKQKALNNGLKLNECMWAVCREECYGTLLFRMWSFQPLLFRMQSFQLLRKD